MRNFQGFTDDDEEYIGSVIIDDAGGIPKKISKRIYAKLEKTQELLVNPLKLLTLLKQELPEAFLKPNQVEQPGEGMSTRLFYLNILTRQTDE